MAAKGGNSPKTGIKRFFDVHPPVFFPATILIAAFIALTLIVGAPIKQIFERVQNGISDHFGWLYVLMVNFYLFFVLYLAFSKYGSIKLGGSKAVPEFSRGAWFAMLFSAGMGIGILFWSVAEPIYHFQEPPVEVPDQVHAAIESMGTTFLHWGLHAWGIYSLVGMALAFFAFNRRQPLAIRSVFYPVFGERINGRLGDVIDVFAVLATMFGLATSLGFGVQQISAGLEHIFGFSFSNAGLILLVAIITLAATMSVVSGLDKGVKRLSEMNINLGAILLVFVLLLGPTIFILDSYFQNVGNYIGNFFPKSFWTESYRGTNWQNQWTVFYWAWWISWSPFVGMFIARISRGRTVREFVLSVLIIPSLLTFLWITAFGGSAIHLEMNEITSLAGQVKENVAISIYILLESFPIAQVTNIVAMILVLSFFVTSADSGSLVVDTFTSGGKLNSPVTQRVFWAVLQGAVAAVLLIGGGLGALQAAAITTGLPFALILFVMALSLRKGLSKEYESELLREKALERESYRELVEKLVAYQKQQHTEAEKDEKKTDEGDKPSGEK